MTVFPVTVQPTFEGWVAWVYSNMGIPVAWLPVDSPWLFYAYNAAYATVNPAFKCIPGPIYMVMVYNLAGHQLVSWTPDPTWEPGPVPGDPPKPFIIVDDQPYGFFQYLRKQNNIGGFTSGIVESSSDNGSSVSLAVAEQNKDLTLGQLALTTTIWGRTYLGYAQDYGTNWGLS